MSTRTTDRLRLAAVALILVAACSDDGGLVADGGGDLPRGDGVAPDLWLGDGPAPDGAGAACLPGPALLGRVDPARMLLDLQQLVAMNRASYTGQSQAAAYIKAELGKLAGVQVREQGYTYGGQAYVNLEATIAGGELADEAMLAGGHYDCAVAPGADDNASGVATVLEIARALSGCVPRRSVRLLFFSNEELGTIGSSQYVTSIKATLPPEKVLGFIAVDMVAYGLDTEDLDLQTRPAFAGFVDEAAAAVEKHTTLKVKKVVSDQCG